MPSKINKFEIHSNVYREYITQANSRITYTHKYKSILYTLCVYACYAIAAAHRSSQSNFPPLIHNTYNCTVVWGLLFLCLSVCLSDGHRYCLQFQYYIKWKLLSLLWLLNKNIVMNCVWVLLSSVEVLQARPRQENTIVGERNNENEWMNEWMLIFFVRVNANAMGNSTAAWIYSIWLDYYTSFSYGEF